MNGGFKLGMLLFFVWIHAMKVERQHISLFNTVNFFFTKIADIKFYSSRFKLYIKLLKNINLSTGSYLLIITKPAIWLGNYYAKKK